MNFQPFAFYLAALAGGILIQNWLGFSAYKLGFFLFLVLLILIFTFFKGFRNLFVFTSLASILMVGAIVFSFHKLPESIDEISLQKVGIKVKVKEFLKPSEKYQKYTGKILNAENSTINHQKILLYIPKDKPLIFPGQNVLLKGSLQAVPPALNPHQFDYRNYLKHKEIGLQIFAREIKVTDESLNTSGWFWKQKTQIKKRLEKNQFSTTSQLFIASLGLGDRTDFSAELTQKLSFAGVIHLFAISGLHVGIVFGLMMILGLPLLRFPYGRKLRIVFSLLMIWLYAWFIGFSPSVTRAALMLTIYYATFLLQRPTNIYHTLCLAAFILLLIQPHQLFDVGFLLSFSAVFFIVYFNPIREKFKMKILKRWRKIYDIAVISLFAQLGVMPVILYYFGNFSFLFLFANILLILLAGFLVILSLLLVGWVIVADAPQILVKTVNFGMEMIYQLIDFFAHQDGFIVQNISWNWVQILAWLSALIFMKKILEKHTIQPVLGLLCCVVLFESARWVETYQAEQKKELIVFHQYRGSVLGWRDGRELRVFYKGENIKGLRDFILKPYIRKEKIKALEIFEFGEDFAQGKFHKIGSKIKLGDTRISLMPPNTNASYIIEKDESQWRVIDGIFRQNKIEKANKNSLIYKTQEKGALILRNF